MFERDVSVNGFLYQSSAYIPRKKVHTDSTPHDTIWQNEERKYRKRRNKYFVRTVSDCKTKTKSDNKVVVKQNDNSWKSMDESLLDNNRDNIFFRLHISTTQKVVHVLTAGAVVFVIVVITLTSIVFPLLRPPPHLKPCIRKYRDITSFPMAQRAQKMRL